MQQPTYITFFLTSQLCYHMIKHHYKSTTDPLLPSGKLTKLWKITTVIDKSPINSHKWAILSSHVSLPEGTLDFGGLFWLLTPNCWHPPHPSRRQASRSIGWRWHIRLSVQDFVALATENHGKPWKKLWQ